MKKSASKKKGMETSIKYMKIITKLTAHNHDKNRESPVWECQLKYLLENEDKLRTYRMDWAQ